MLEVNEMKSLMKYPLLLLVLVAGCAGCGKKQAPSSNQGAVSGDANEDMPQLEQNIEKYIAFLLLTEAQQQQFNQRIGLKPTKVLLVEEPSSDYTQTRYFRFEQIVRISEWANLPKVKDEFVTIQFSPEQKSSLTEILSSFLAQPSFAALHTNVPSKIEFHVGESQPRGSKERMFHFVSNTFYGLEVNTDVR
jgi:predicted small lipoprotein YifL